MNVTNHIQYHDWTFIFFEKLKYIYFQTYRNFDGVNREVYGKVSEICETSS